MAEMRKIIGQMSPTHSTGLDGLSMQLIKENLRPIEGAILNMINQSIHSGIFPHSLKNSCVIPILKP